MSEFRPKESTTRELLKVAGTISTELANLVEGDDGLLPLASRVIGERVAALISSLAFQRAAYDPGAKLPVVFWDCSHGEANRWRRFVPAVERGLVGRLGLVKAHGCYPAAMNLLAADFADWAAQQRRFAHDHQRQLFAICEPLQPSWSP